MSLAAVAGTTLSAKTGWGRRKLLLCYEFQTNGLFHLSITPQTPMVYQIHPQLQRTESHSRSLRRSALQTGHDLIHM